VRIAAGHWSASQLSSTAAADTWKVSLALLFVLFWGASMIVDGTGVAESGHIERQLKIT
jgi:hypothetical protein